MNNPPPQALLQEPQKNDYLIRPVVYNQLFSVAECERILALPYPQVNQGQVFGEGGSGLQVDTSIRRVLSRVVEPWHENRWIFERVRQLFELVNETYYKFHLTGQSPLQVLEYRADDFYDWHLDLGDGDVSTRKLSCVVFLSPRSDYEGGRLQVKSPKRELDQTQGNAAVFPSYLIHRVEPVSRGQRWTMVAWAHGDAFH